MVQQVRKRLCHFSCALSGLVWLFALTQGWVALGYYPVLTGHMVNRSYRAHGEQIPKGNIEW